MIAVQIIGTAQRRPHNYTILLTSLLQNESNRRALPA